MIRRSDMSADLTAYLCRRLREVQDRLGMDLNVDPDTPFGDLVDSMGLVELVGLVSADCGVRPETIEQAVGRHFTTLTELARAMKTAGITPLPAALPETVSVGEVREATAWLSAPKLVLPREVQPAVMLDEMLGRPAGWLEQHAGITSRRVWGNEDALAATAAAALTCLQESAIGIEELAALLVTSEAPPRPLGLAAALHTRMSLPAHIPALEIGGACTGLLHGLWLGQRLVRPGAAVLLAAVESPSSWLAVRPGPEGEAAALFGDGAGVCLLTAASTHASWPIGNVVLGSDRTAGDLVRLRIEDRGPVVEMDGPALAVRAVRQLAVSVEQVAAAHGLRVADLGGMVIHAGNGRLPALVAQRLGVPSERIHSTTEWTGNLGSVSLLAALAHRSPELPAVCAAVGAGLCWGAVLLGPT
jgi:3-oxoacyl-[acyl-carrier-protein] synthase-3